MKATTWLRCGLVAGPLFTVTYLVTGVVREGYDPIRHPVSTLQINGWAQTANFVVAGLLTVAFAIGARKLGFWGPLLIAAVGIGLIGSGVFLTDPVSGYPPGSPPGSPPISEYTWHGRLHDLFAVPTFLGWPLACFVLAKRFAPVYSVISAVAFLIAIVATSAAFAQTGGLVEFGGLLQRITITIGWTWLTLLALHLIRTVPVLVREPTLS